MNNIIVAIVGMCGTGKSEAAKYIELAYKFKSVYFGGYVLKEVKKRNLEINADNEKLVREDLRSQHGLDVIARLAVNDINSFLQAGSNVIIDGLYSFSEYLFLKEKFGKQLFVLSIQSARKIRYQRLGARKTRSLTPGQVDERDFSEIKNIEKAGPIAVADYHIINDDDLQRLYENIDGILQEIMKPQNGRIK